MDQKPLGRAIRSARLKRKLTLRELEKEAHVTNSYLSRLERGQAKAPEPHILHDLSVVLELNYLTLMILAGHVSVRHLSNFKRGGRL